MGRLAELFDPETVAVVGATDREGAVGRAITANLRDRFDGEVVPINPGRDEVLGLECYSDVSSAPPIDLAVVVVPPDAVIDALNDLGEAGTRNVVVITAGFSETGGEGADRERRLREVAEEYDLNVVGPNSLGVMHLRVEHCGRIHHPRAKRAVTRRSGVKPRGGGLLASTGFAEGIGERQRRSPQPRQKRLLY